MMDKTVSRCHFKIFFSYFSKKIDGENLQLSPSISLGNHVHESSKPVFSKKKKKISSKPVSQKKKKKKLKNIINSTLARMCSQNTVESVI